MSDVPNLNDVVFEDSNYYNFYEAFIECDFCGQQTRGRVYGKSVNVICGACDAVLLTLTEVEQCSIRGTFPR